MMMSMHARWRQWNGTDLTTHAGAEGQEQYGVEHHEQGRVQSLGQLTGVAPHHTSLEIYVGKLLCRGARGLLLLIDEATGAIVARRAVRPFAAKPRTRSRQPQH
jgi:hypothetical protein